MIMTMTQENTKRFSNKVQITRFIVIFLPLQSKERTRGFIICFLLKSFLLYKSGNQNDEKKLLDGIEADASKQLTRRCFVKVPLQDMQDFSHRKDFF